MCESQGFSNPDIRVMDWYCSLIKDVDKQSLGRASYMSLATTQRDAFYRQSKVRHAERTTILEPGIIIHMAHAQLSRHVRLCSPSCMVYTKGIPNETMADVFTLRSHHSACRSIAVGRPQGWRAGAAAGSRFERARLRGSHCVTLPKRNIGRVGFQQGQMLYLACCWRCTACELDRGDFRGLPPLPYLPWWKDFISCTWYAGVRRC